MWQHLINEQTQGDKRKVRVKLKVMKETRGESHWGRKRRVRLKLVVLMSKDGQKGAILTGLLNTRAVNISKNKVQIHSEWPIIRSDKIKNPPCLLWDLCKLAVDNQVSVVIITFDLCVFMWIEKASSWRCFSKYNNVLQSCNVYLPDFFYTK